MEYYRVHLPTMKADFTPIPSYLIGFGPNELGDLTWIPPEFENGYLVGYAWWPEVNVTRPIGMYERYVGTPRLTVKPATKKVEAVYDVEPWTAEEIALDKQMKFIDAGIIVNRVVEEWCDEIARRFGFFGRTPFLMALTYINSTLPDEKARAEVLTAWRDAVRVESVAIVNGVLQTGERLSEEIVRDRLPAVPAIPTVPAEPPAEPPVPEPETPADPPVDPVPDPAP